MLSHSRRVVCGKQAPRGGQLDKHPHLGTRHCLGASFNFFIEESSSSLPQQNLLHRLKKRKKMWQRGILGLICCSAFDKEVVAV